VVLEAFLLEGLLIDHITKAEENLLTVVEMMFSDES
jgi:hypothetical protein